MQTLHFSVTIRAPREKVWQTMLGDTTYPKWTAAFMAGTEADEATGSNFKGSWEKGSKIQFVSADETGKFTGMTSRIAENIPYEFLSIEHLGLVKDDIEDTTSAEAKEWQGFENYTFKDLGSLTKVLVDIDAKEDFAEYLEETWPKALAKLKELAEK